MDLAVYANNNHVITPQQWYNDQGLKSVILGPTCIRGWRNIAEYGGHRVATNGPWNYITWGQQSHSWGEGNPMWWEV